MKTDRRRQTERDSSRDTDIHEHCKHPSFLPPTPSSSSLLSAGGCCPVRGALTGSGVKRRLPRADSDEDCVFVWCVFYRLVHFYENLRLPKVYTVSVVFVCWNICKCDRLLVCILASVQQLCGCISLLVLLSGKINLYLQNVNFSTTKNSMCISKCAL